MGFECALALVVPEADTVNDFEKGPEYTDEDAFFDERRAVPIAVRSWRVFKFIDFSRVRMIDKSNSSQSPAERAAGRFDNRAAKCTASFLLGKFFEKERLVVAGDLAHVVPFVADHYLTIGGERHRDSLEYRFQDVFAITGSTDVVTHLWRSRRELGENVTLPEIFSGALWEHNRLLLAGDVVGATTLEGHFCESPCGLVWVSAAEVSDWLTELLAGGGIEGEELRKDLLSVTLVETWRDTLLSFDVHGTRVIPLTGSFHSDCTCAVRSQYMHL